MIRNYFRIAIRNLIRHKGYTFINISGLAIGIAACLLIFLVVRYELSYDSFQKNYDRVYRVVTSGVRSDGNQIHNPGMPCPAYDALKADFPQLEKITPVAATTQSQVTVLGNDPNSDVAIRKKFIENRNIVFTYPEYFDLFNAKWLAGNASSLKEPGNSIIDKSSAIKYFGDWKNAMGQFLKLDNTALLKITGVVEDAPLNSDFPIPLFISYETFKQYTSN